MLQAAILAESTTDFTLHAFNRCLYSMSITAIFLFVSKVFTGDIQRCHDGDAFRADNLTAILQLVQFTIQILRCIIQLLAFIVITGNQIILVQYGDIDGSELLAHVRVSMARRREIMDSILVLACSVFSIRAARSLTRLSCWFLRAEFSCCN